MVNIIDKRLNFQSNHQIRSGKPTGIVLHHPAVKSASVETIHSWHLDNDWAGIGYHFYVRKDGKVYRGRPENWIGAHTVGKNDAIGICAEGNFENETMPTAQKEAIVELIKYLRGKYGSLEITRHKDWYATACPGKNYPFEAIVEAAKSTAPKPTANPTEMNLVAKFQQACLCDRVSVGECGVDGLWGKDTEAAANNALVNGSNGARVKLLQNFLIAAGFSCGNEGADGIFGDNTEKAVKAYQGKHNLVKDGEVGIKTWKSLLGV